jgi:hypothetical protein
LPRGLRQTNWYEAEEYFVYRTRSSYREDEIERDVRTGDAKDVEDRPRTRQIIAKTCIVYRS